MSDLLLRRCLLAPLKIPFKQPSKELFRDLLVLTDLFIELEVVFFAAETAFPFATSKDTLMADDAP